MKAEYSAGGIVVRRFRGRPFIVAIHPRKQDALALPKGHPDPGETAAEAALREVREETGVDAALEEQLGDVRYWYVRKGKRRRKVVTFFLFRYRSGSIRDHDREVESAEWIPLDEAVGRLTYKGEREMAALALERVGEDGRAQVPR